MKASRPLTSSCASAALWRYSMSSVRSRSAESDASTDARMQAGERQWLPPTKSDTDAAREDSKRRLSPTWGGCGGGGGGSCILLVQSSSSSSGRCCALRCIATATTNTPQCSRNRLGRELAAVLGCVTQPCHFQQQCVECICHSSSSRKVQKQQRQPKNQLCLLCDCVGLINTHRC